MDDLIVTCETRCGINLRAFLQQSFPTKDLGNLSYYVVCEYVRNRSLGTLKMTQTIYIDRLVEKFGVTTSSPTPALSSVSLSPRQGTEVPCTQPYREAVGGSMWISNATRPDISNAVREVARQAHDPSEKHWRLS